MGEWLVRTGDPAPDPVSVARNREVLEYDIDGHAFVFSCEVVPNGCQSGGVAVVMHLAERDGAAEPPVAAEAGRMPVRVDDLAAAFEGDELPRELDLATIVTCRSRTEWLFASAAELVRSGA